MKQSVMRRMYLLGIVLLSISVLFLGFLADAFSEAYTRWHLPPGAKARLGKGKINAVKYFPDGSKLAVATAIGIWIYDVHTGEELDLLTGHTGQIYSVAFSSDGKFLPLEVAITRFCYGTHRRVNRKPLSSSTQILFNQSHLVPIVKCLRVRVTTTRSNYGTHSLANH